MQNIFSCMSRTVTHALYKAASAKYRAKLAINKYEEKLDAMRHKLYRDYREVLYITRTRLYGGSTSRATQVQYARL